MTIGKSKDLILSLQQSGLLNQDLSLDELIEKTEQLSEQLGATIANGTAGAFIIKHHEKRENVSF
ncbi:hypothetical protein [Peribacillus frigoritolerans]|uniref:hypothetical protein n=1 Tax=Peribacillus frigoritolerans TaxID=450367 RepID=UPI003B8D4893